MAINASDIAGAAYAQGYADAIKWNRDHLIAALGPDAYEKAMSQARDTGHRGIEVSGFLYLREDGSPEVLQLRLPGALS